MFSWIAVSAKGDVHPAGRVVADMDPSADLIFVLSGDAISGDHVLAGQRIDWPDGPALLRVDEVCFPVGAVAHRHTHTGAGFRHLVRGLLRLETGDHNQTMGVGDSWFEPLGTSVRAVAMQDAGVTSFVRCMIVPLAFAGKSTCQLVDPADAAMPRLQMTHRHIDHPIQVDAE